MEEKVNAFLPISALGPWSWGVYIFSIIPPPPPQCRGEINFYKISFFSRKNLYNLQIILRRGDWDLYDDKYYPWNLKILCILCGHKKLTLEDYWIGKSWTKSKVLTFGTWRLLHTLTEMFNSLRWYAFNACLKITISFLSSNLSP